MKNDIGTNDLISRLKGEPDVSGWELLIKELINGKYEYLAIRLGGIEEIIEKTISESNDPSISRYIFMQALRIVIQEWQTSISDPLEIITAYLNLIGSYTPAEGYIKITFLIQKWLAEKIDDMPDRQRRFFTTLLKKSLIVLHRYFSSAPPPNENIPAFQVYLDILWQYLKNKRLREYAIYRLLDLHLIFQNIDKLKEIIRSMPDVMYHFVSIIIDREADIKENLSSLFDICFDDSKLEKIFYNSLRKKSAKKDEGQSGPEITLQNGVTVIIELSGKQLDLYMSKKWNDDSRRMKKLVANYQAHPMYELAHT